MNTSQTAYSARFLAFQLMQDWTHEYARQCDTTATDLRVLAALKQPQLDRAAEQARTDRAAAGQPDPAGYVSPFRSEREAR
jgi:hypothetical protein